MSTTGPRRRPARHPHPPPPRRRGQPARRAQRPIRARRLDDRLPPGARRTAARRPRSPAPRGRREARARLPRLDPDDLMAIAQMDPGSSPP